MLAGKASSATSATEYITRISLFVAETGFFFTRGTAPGLTMAKASSANPIPARRGRAMEEYTKRREKAAETERPVRPNTRAYVMGMLVLLLRATVGPKK